MTGFTKLIFAMLALGAFAAYRGAVSADDSMSQRCEPGHDCVIGEYIFDDDGHTPIVTDGFCRITITNPNDEVVANGVDMNHKNDGWYYYTVNISDPLGLYRSKVCCSVGQADEQCLDKTFILGISFESLSADSAVIKQNVDFIRNSTFDFSGSADGGTITTLVDADLTQPDDYWNEYELVMLSGSNAGERRTISDFVNSNQTLTVASAFSNAIAPQDKYVISHEKKMVDTIWTWTDRQLTSATNIASAVWSYSGARTLTAIGSLAADIWDNSFAPTRRLTDATLTAGGDLATKSDVDSSKADLLAAINDNAALIGQLNDISASDVWDYGARSLNQGVDLSSSSTLAIWNVAKSQLVADGSVGQQIVNNLDAQVSSRSALTAGDVWASATRTLTDYNVDATALAVWQSAQRTLTEHGESITAADVWNTLSSSLTGVGTIGNQLAQNVDSTISSRASQGSVDTIRDSQQRQWSVYLSDVTDISKGDTYRAKLWVLNYESVPTDAITAPTVTIYDPVRNISINAVPMTKLSAGIYEYAFHVASSAIQGTWETEVSATVEAGKTIKTNDYWGVAGSPAQVKINSMSDLVVPDIAANVTLTNEGTTGYEYQYEWCVVSSQNNACGGNDDVYYSSAAKLIQPGQDWVTDLAAVVPNPGNYWFKLVVHFGTAQSGASQSFTAQAASGGGGSGGSESPYTKGISNLAKKLWGQDTTFCKIFPCDIIDKILARLDASEKMDIVLNDKITALDAKISRMSNVAPAQIIYRSVTPAAAPVKTRARIQLETQ